MKLSVGFFPLYIGLILVVTACSAPESSAKKQQKETTNEQVMENAPGKDLTKDLRAELEGEWVNHRFFSKVAQTKEVYSNRSELKGLYGFELRSKGEELRLKGAYVHEGGLDTRFRLDETSERPRFISGKRSLEMKGNLLCLTENGKETKFHKVVSYKNELRRLVASGTYISGGKKIVLKNDGKCEFGNFKSYDVIVDFTEGIEFDALVFYTNPKGGNWANGVIYHFDWEKALFLNIVDTDWDTYNHQLREEVLELNPQ